jgi:hypothetical protein
MSGCNSDIFTDVLKIVCPCDKPFCKIANTNINLKMGQVQIPGDINNIKSTPEIGRRCFDF